MSTDEIDAKKREIPCAKVATVIAQYLVEHDVMVYHDVPDNNGKESL